MNSEYFNIKNHCITGLTDLGKQQTNLVIPKEITHLEDFVFADCNNLHSVTFEENSKLKEIPDFAFLNCKSLKEISLPNHIEIINYGAFNHCENLQSIIIPQTIKYIESDVFQSCKSLKTITFDPNSQLKEIGEGTFGDSALTSITIPKSVTFIGTGAFEDCKSLKTVTFEDYYESIEIGKYAFDICPPDAQYFVNSEKVKQVLLSSYSNINPSQIIIQGEK